MYSYLETETFMLTGSWWPYTLTNPHLYQLMEVAVSSWTLEALLSQLRWANSIKPHYKQSANVDRIKFMPSDMRHSLYAYSIITCIF